MVVGSDGVSSTRFEGTGAPADADAGVLHLMSTQEPTDDEIEAELNTMLGAPAAAAALADVKQEA